VPILTDGGRPVLPARLGHGASKVVGIDQEAEYLRVARRRVGEG
jgi:hypothetical protein